jgi:hypothetical protein
VMTRDDIIRLAQESKLYSGKPRTPATGRMIEKRLKRFAALVAAAEREACAKVCDDKHYTWRWDNESDSASGPRDCAVAIRARGESK